MEPVEAMYLNFSTGWGGLEIFSANLHAWMRAAGCVVPFAAWRGSRLAQRLAQGPAAQDLLALRPLRYCDPWTVRRLARAVHDRRIPVLHTFKSTDVFLAAAIKRRLGGRVALVHHLQMLPHTSRRGWLHARAYRSIDCLLAITNQVRRRVLEFWPVPAERVRTLYYGIDPAPFAAARERRDAMRAALRIPPDARVVTVVGNVHPDKGQRFVLDAVEALRGTYPDLMLLLAGAPSPVRKAYVRDLRGAIADGRDGWVRWPGFCDDVPGVLAAGDVFVLGSREEAFGLVVVEAMAAGCVVVASAGGGVPEILSDGDNGFLYPPCDAGGLQAALRRALELLPAARAGLVARAQATVQERFSRERMLEEIRSVYASVTTSLPAGGLECP